jgi:hypothetical protein
MSWFVQQALAGNCFIGSTAQAGVVLPTMAGTAHVFGLWNPTGSGVGLVLNRLTLTPITVTTTVIGGVGLGLVANAGSQTGTAAPIVSLTSVAPVNAVLGYGAVSKARFAPGAITLGANPSWLYGPGIFSPDGDMATSLSNTIINHDFNGGVIIPPGVAIVVAGSAALGQTYNLALTWAETPINLGSL